MPQRIECVCVCLLALILLQSADEHEVHSKLFAAYKLGGFHVNLQRCRDCDDFPSPCGFRIGNPQVSDLHVLIGAWLGTIGPEKVVAQKRFAPAYF